MKANQKGFSVVEILIVIVVVGLLGTVGWLVYGRQKGMSDDKATNTQASQQEQKDTPKQETKDSGTTATKFDATVHEVDIRMQAETDTSRLPDYTPSSFKAYMLNLLKNNKSYDNSEATVTPQYVISKISQVNISGGQAPVDKAGNGYPGGAPAIWVLTPAGTWDQETLNGPVCKSKNGGLIYEEFVKECSDSSSAWVKNPNGSIKSLAQ